MNLYKLKDGQTINIKLQITYIVIALATAYLSCLKSYGTAPNIKIIAVFSFVVCFLSIVEWLALPKEKNEYLSYFVLFLFLVLSCFPLLSNGFLYFDDLWTFVRNGENTLLGLSMRRPFIDVLLELFPKITFDSSSILRRYNFVIYVLFSFVLNKYLMLKMKNTAKSLFITFMMVGGVISADMLGYLSIFPANYALLFSAYGYIAFMDALNIKCFLSGKICKLFIGIISLLSAFMYYQILTPIVFVLVAIDFITCKKEDLKKCVVNNAKFAVFYSAIALMYLKSTSLLLVAFGFPVNNSRGEISLSGQFIERKIKWFVGDVIPNVYNHISASLMGNHPFNDQCLFYQIVFKQSALRNIMYFLITGIILYCLYQVYKKSNIYNVVLAVFMIPVSFYCFLLLPESTILTYYMYPLISLFMFFFSLGIYLAISSKKTCQHFSLAIIAIVIMINGNLYTDKFWVQYNRAGYHIIKNTIASNYSTKIHKIHLYGKLMPYEANIYGIMAMKHALSDLHIANNDIMLTSSDNQYYLSVIEKDAFEEGLKSLSDTEKKDIKDFYAFGDMYNQYYLKEYPSQENKKMILQRLSHKTQWIPKDDSNDIIKIDLNKTLSALYHY